MSTANVLISWTAPTVDSGGNPLIGGVDSYELTYNIDGGTTVGPIAKSATDLNHTVSNVADGSTVNATVVAIKDGNNSLPANGSLTVVAPGQTPGPVTLTLSQV